MTEDERYMKRAIELGWRGIGRNSPNPLVGCVIVRDGEIVGEGSHLFSDVDHAEIIALKQAGGKARGATVYVGLEPCCHTGRTPPCCPAIIKAGISRVVYGMKDPDPRVNGEGHKALQEAGIEVVGGVLVADVREQNKFFVTTHEKGRPYVLLKWAMTLDGVTTSRTGENRWISNKASRNTVHHLRNIYDSILVGHSTVLIDDPKLTCRVDLSKPLPMGIFPAAPVDIRHPARVVVDAFGATCSVDFQIFQQPGETLIATAEESYWGDTRALDSITETIEQIECPLDKGHISLEVLLKNLVDRGISSVLVEGGSRMHSAFIKAGLADEVAVYIAPKIFGGEQAPSPLSGSGMDIVEDAWHVENVDHIEIDGDLLVTGKIVMHEGAD